MNYDLPDPGLTDKGKEQCIQLEKWLREHLPLADEVEAIISSPMVRTLQTTLLSLDWLLKRGLEIEVDALWQGSFLCLILSFSILVPLDLVCSCREVRSNG